MSILLSLSLLAAIALAGPQGHQAHAQDRGRHAMGFDQQRTEHHFLIEPQGGTIQVTARDSQDVESERQIRAHLRHITQAFGIGDFSLPVFVHDTEPPGAAVMKERRAALAYTFVPIHGGGKVAVRTSDTMALAAVHEFLRFQIREHKTGDPLEPTAAKK